MKNKDWCEDEIKSRLKNWEFDRVALLDRLLLIVAISEIFFLDDVPPKVSISEAIELAKEYSTKESSNFINGVLEKRELEYMIVINLPEMSNYKENNFVFL